MDNSIVDSDLKRILLRSWIHTLLLTVWEMIKQKNMDNIEFLNGISRKQCLVIKSKQYIKEHYYEDITLDKLSGILEVSPCYLSRIFHRESGFSIIAYLTMVRMEKAFLMLRTQTQKNYILNISEIAIAVGYKSVSYFSKVFKRYFGVSPKEIKISPISER